MADDKTVVTDDTPATKVEGTTVLDDAPVKDTKTDDKSQDTKAGDTKTDTKTDGDGKPAVPEKYELKIAKDSLVDESELAEIAEEAKALKLSQEDAQKLVERRSADRAKYMDSARAKLADTVQGWRESLAKDAEIGGKGGSEYDANIARARLAINKFGTPELKKALNETGYGNHPEVVRFMIRVGKALKEDSFHTDSKHDKGGDPTEERLNKFYGQTKST